MVIPPIVVLCVLLSCAPWVLQRVQALYVLSPHTQLLSPDISKSDSHVLLLSKYETPHASTSIHTSHTSVSNLSVSLCLCCILIIQQNITHASIILTRIPHPITRNFTISHASVKSSSVKSSSAMTLLLPVCIQCVENYVDIILPISLVSAQYISCFLFLCIHIISSLTYSSSAPSNLKNLVSSSLQRSDLSLFLLAEQVTLVLSLNRVIKLCKILPDFVLLAI
jgi:hypothetical protein